MIQKNTAREMRGMRHSRKDIELVSSALRSVVAAFEFQERRMNAHGLERAERKGLVGEAADGHVAGELFGRHPIATCIREAYGEREILVSGRWYLLDPARSRGE